MVNNPTSSQNNNTIYKSVHHLWYDARPLISTLKMPLADTGCAHFVATKVVKNSTAALTLRHGLLRSEVLFPSPGYSLSESVCEGVSFLERPLNLLGGILCVQCVHLLYWTKIYSTTLSWEGSANEQLLFSPNYVTLPVWLSLCSESVAPGFYTVSHICLYTVKRVSIVKCFGSLRHWIKTKNVSWCVKYVKDTW